MQFLEFFYLKNFKYDLINKFSYKNNKILPKIKTINLNFGCKTTELKNLSASLLALELITQQKGKLTTTKYPNILLKLRKGNPVGCKVILNKKQIFYFLEKTLINVFPRTKNFNGLNLNAKVTAHSFSFKIHDTSNFAELEPHYYLFNNLPKLTVTIKTSLKTKEELTFLLNTFQIPIKQFVSKIKQIEKTKQI
jgi:large subunit ribosomal protein L5